MAPWYEEAEFYHIYPIGLTGAPRKNESEETVHRFSTLEQWLPHIADLGCTAIYIGPLFESTTHGYDTKDYKQVDRRLGDNADFAAYVKKAHELGIKVVVDGVFNHTGREFFAFRDIQEKREQSPYCGWYKGIWFGGNTCYNDGFSYEAWRNCFELVNLNLQNQQVRDYLLDVIDFWIDEFDIDGIRFDVGNEVSHRFLKELRRQLKSVKPDLYLLGEIWHDASQWLGGDEYDSVMNYPLTSGIQDFFLDQAAEKDEFEYMVNRCYTMYMQQNNNVIFNLLDSHDTERLMNRCQDLDIFYQQLAILFTMPGSPCIYYGTEIALEGAHDPDCRRCMPWDEIDSAENQKKIELMKSLIRMRIQEDACRSLYFDFPHKYSQKRCVEYRKLNLDGKWIEVLLNCGSEPIEIQGQGEILFARRCEGNSLDVRGTLIRRLPSTV